MYCFQKAMAFFCFPRETERESAAVTGFADYIKNNFEKEKKHMKSKKSALLLSFTSLLLCFAMLAGSTFAWFTDTATTGVNQIKSGTLDVGLEMATAWNEDGTVKTWDNAEGKTLTFKTADNRAANEIFWEPNCTYKLPELRVVNKGNLALKYKVEITGIQGDAKLNEVIAWTIVKGVEGTNSNAIFGEDGNPTGEYFLLPAGETTAPLTIEGHMDQNAGNEYQNLTIDGIGITVLATQYTYEKDSISDQYDKDAAYAQGAYIVGLTDENGKTVTFDTLTAAAKAWRESKGVVTSGNTFGMNSLGTVDSITWVISGEVATGDGAGVIGDNGAGQSILGGGYFTPSVTVNNIIVKGVNDAKIAKIGESYLVSAGGEGTSVVYENITFVDTVRIDSNPVNLTFKNCTFEAGFRMPHSADNGNVTIENCTFTGNESSGYAIFAQGNMASFKINGNKISGCQRGINVQAGNNAVVTIDNNTITNITGITKNDRTYGAAIQLTSAKTFTITNNTISGVAVNALHIWANDTGAVKCNPDSIVIKDNTISADYLCWNEANYTNVTSSGNTLTITHEGECVTKTEVKGSTFTLN